MKIKVEKPLVIIRKICFDGAREYMHYIWENIGTLH
jgi:hypothetical protein